MKKNVSILNLFCFNFSPFIIFFFKKRKSCGNVLCCWSSEAELYDAQATPHLHDNFGLFEYIVPGRPRHIIKKNNFLQFKFQTSLSVVCLFRTWINDYYCPIYQVQLSLLRGAISYKPSFKSFKGLKAAISLDNFVSP